MPTRGYRAALSLSVEIVPASATSAFVNDSRLAVNAFQPDSAQEFFNLFGSLLIPTAGTASVPLPNDAHRLIDLDSSKNADNDPESSVDGLPATAINMIQACQIPAILLGPMGLPLGDQTGNTVADSAAGANAAQLVSMSESGDDITKTQLRPQTASVLSTAPSGWSAFKLRIVAAEGTAVITPATQLAPKSTPAELAALPGRNDSTKVSATGPNLAGAEVVPNVTAAGGLTGEGDSPDFAASKGQQPEEKDSALESRSEFEKNVATALGHDSPAGRDDSRIAGAKPPGSGLQTASHTLDQIADKAPAGASQPLRELSLRIAGSNDSQVDLHVSDRAGQIRVDVRSTNPNLVAELQTHTDDLAANLRQKGYHTEISKPAESANAVATHETPGQQPSRDNSSDSGGQGRGAWQQQQQNQEEQQQRRRSQQSWLNFLEQHSTENASATSKES